MLIMTAHGQTSFGGRNRKCAEAFVRSPEKTFEQLEEELLNGQRLQGVSEEVRRRKEGDQLTFPLVKVITSEEIYDFLASRDRLEGYPLFEKVYHICKREMDPKELFEAL